MKKYLSILMFTLLFNGYATAEIENEICCYQEVPMLNEMERESSASFNYWSLGTGPLPLTPSIGVGHRYYNGHYGYDVSLNLASIAVISSAQVVANMLYIPNPSAQNAWYCGAGLAVGGMAFGNYKHGVFTVAPNFVIGKEFKNTSEYKTFLEANIQVPTWGSRIHRHTRLDMPLICVKYGMSF